MHPDRQAILLTKGRQASLIQPVFFPRDFLPKGTMMKDGDEKSGRPRRTPMGGPGTEESGPTVKRAFVKPTLTRHERLHQVARFGQASSVAGLQTVGVVS